MLWNRCRVIRGALSVSRRRRRFKMWENMFTKGEKRRRDRMEEERGDLATKVI